MILCSLAICLVWVTSLRVAVSLVGHFVSSPTTTDVLDRCRFLLRETQSQGENYRKCASAQLNICKRDLDWAYSNEFSRIAAQALVNSNLIRRASNYSSVCATNFTAVQFLVRQWETTNTNYKLPFRSNCSAQNIQTTQSLLGNTAAVQASAVSSAQQYMQSSSTTVRHLAEYAEELSAYNREYLLNKTGRIRLTIHPWLTRLSLPFIASINESFSGVRDALSAMLACVSLVGVAGRPCELIQNNLGLSTLYEQDYSLFISQLNVAQKVITAYQVSLQQVESATTQAQQQADQYFEVVNDAISSIQSALQTIGISSGICGLTSPDVCAFDKIDWEVILPSAPKPPTLPTPPSAEQLWGQVMDVVPTAFAAIDSASAEVFNEATAWAQHLSVSFPDYELSLDDYHPPAYPWATNVSNEVQRLDRQAEAVMETVQSLTSLTTTLNEIAQAEIFNASAYTISAPPLSMFSFSLEAMSGSDFHWLSWILPDLSFQGLALLLDYVYRFICSFRLLRRHWTRSVVRIPLVDIRADRSSDSDEDASNKLMLSMTMLEVSLFLVVLALVAVACSWIVLGLYLPLYDDYVSGCVAPTTSGNGSSTFIGRNVNSMAYNFASESGNAVLLEGMWTYNLDSSHRCASAQGNSQKTATKAAQTLQSIVSNHQKVLSNAATVRSCLDVPVMDSVIEAACDGTAAAPYKCPLQSAAQPHITLASLLSSAACLDPMTSPDWQLVDAVFDCARLPACSTSCQGPDTVLLPAVGDICSCSAQWWLHASVTNVGGAIFVYILLNIFRLFFYRGVVMLNWRHLIPNLFEYSATCDLSGKFICTPGQEKVDQRLLVRHKLARIIRIYEAKGVLFLLLAALCLVPCALLLLYSRDIAFAPKSR